jgi:glucosamine-6-phosphate deaminase
LDLGRSIAHRIITLDHITRVDARLILTVLQMFPKYYRRGTICCRELFCWLWGKMDIIKRTIQEDISAEVPATFCRIANTTFV